MPACREAQTQLPDSSKSRQRTGSCRGGCWQAQQHHSVGHASIPALRAPRSAASGTGAVPAHTQADTGSVCDLSSELADKTLRHLSQMYRPAPGVVSRRRLQEAADKKAGFAAGRVLVRRSSAGAARPRAVLAVSGQVQGDRGHCAESTADFTGQETLTYHTWYRRECLNCCPREMTQCLHRVWSSVKGNIKRYC